jgi:hypothetical protein
MVTYKITLNYKQNTTPCPMKSRLEKNKCPAKICYAVYLDITHFYYFMQPSHFIIRTFLTDLPKFMGTFSQSLEMYFKCK